MFCGITLKHYAYYNMSRRTQLTTKFVFQTLAQLSENFIFIYLGLTLFTERELIFKPLFILITVVGVCAARYVAVFPLSKVINWVYRFRARRRGAPDVVDELPHSYQVMLFWAGLRGAVGVALAAGLQSSPENFRALQATVLVVVVLTVIIFGGTTARMLEIMGIRTGVVEEVDSDDEFDIETVANGTYYKRSGTAFGHTPTRSDFSALHLGALDAAGNGVAAAPGAGAGAGPSPGAPAGGPPKSAVWPAEPEESYSSSSARPSPPARPANGTKRHGSTQSQRDRDTASRALLGGAGGAGGGSGTRSPNAADDEDDDDDDWDPDLPPAAPRRSPKRRPSPPPSSAADATRPSRSSTFPQPSAAAAAGPSAHLHPPGAEGITASEAIRDFFTGTEDRAAWFRRLDDAVIKPTLLLDQSSKGSGGGGGGGGGGEGGGGGGGGGNGHGRG